MVEGGDVYLTDDGLSRGTGWELELSRVEYSVEMWMCATCAKPRYVYMWWIATAYAAEECI